MAGDQALYMKEPKLKLATLEKLIPNAHNELLYDFGRHLVDYLNWQLLPQGFVRGCDQAIRDLQAGTNTYTKQPIENRLVGCPQPVYSSLRMEIPRIAEVIFPPEFAAEVKTLVNTTQNEIAQKRVGEK